MHIDVKKLGRISGAGHRVTGGRAARTHRAQRRRGAIGWEYVHVCVDDATRLAYVEVLADEKATTAVGFLRRAVAFYAATASRSARDDRQRRRLPLDASTPSPAARSGIRHLRTRPYRPRTNGKAERFIRTLLAGWAYGAIYGSSRERTAALAGWLDLQPSPTTRHPQPQAARQPPHELNNLPGSYS